MTKIFLLTLATTICGAVGANSGQCKVGDECVDADKSTASTLLQTMDVVTKTTLTRTSPEGAVLEALHEAYEEQKNELSRQESDLEQTRKNLKTKKQQLQAANEECESGSSFWNRGLVLCKLSGKWPWLPDMFRDDINAYEKEIKILEASTTELANLVGKLKAETENFDKQRKEQLDDLDEKVAVFKQSVEHMKTQIDSLDGRISDRKAHKEATLEQDKAQIEVAKKANEAKKAEKDAVISKYQTLVEKLQGQIASMSAETPSLLELTMTGPGETHAEATARINTKIEHAQGHAKEQELKQKLEHAKTTLQELTISHTEAISQLGDEIEFIKSAKAHAQEKVKTLEAKEARKELAKQSMEDHKTEFGNVIDTISSGEVDLDKLLTSLTAASSKAKDFIASVKDEQVSDEKAFSDDLDILKIEQNHYQDNLNQQIQSLEDEKTRVTEEREHHNKVLINLKNAQKEHTDLVNAS